MFSRGRNKTKPGLQPKRTIARFKAEVGAQVSAQLNAVMAAILLAATVAPLQAKAALHEYDQVCGDVEAAKNHPETPTAQAIPKLKTSYCDAARDNMAGRNSQNALWKVWAGVASACTLAAALTCGPQAVLSGGAAVHATIGCEALEAGAGLAELTQAATIRERLGGIVGSAVGLGAAATQGKKVAQYIHKGYDKLTGTRHGVDESTVYHACRANLIGAGVAAALSLYKYTSWTSHRDAFEKNLNLARQQKGQNAVDPSANPGSAGNSPITQAIINGSGNGTIGDGSLSETSSAVTAGNDGSLSNSNPSKDPCSDTTHAGGILSCAMASDSRLPSWVNTPDFARDFQKQAGVPLPEFLEKADQVPSPAQALGAVMGGGMSSDQAAGLSSALAQAEQSIRADSSQFAALEKDIKGYSAGGAGHAATGKDAGAPDFNQLMQGMMGGFMPKEGGQTAPLSTMEVNFRKMASRSPASNADDKQISIFDRVAFRYHFVENRFIQELSQSAAGSQGGGGK